VTAFATPSLCRYESPPNKSLERTRDRSSAKLKRRRAGRSTQPLGGAPEMPQDPQELLQSLSDVMFPSDPEAQVRIDSVGYDGDTPLHVVAWRNDLHGVVLLLDAGADVNAKGEMDETPLHIAVHHGNAQMVQAMLQAGARMDIRSEFGDTPRDRANRQGGEMSALFDRTAPPNTSLERTRDR
jgi:uncharacterized protein